MTNHLQLNKLLQQNQFGFQRNTSTEHNLLKVFNLIGDSLNRGNFCIGIFLDLRKAFDTCSHNILLKKLLKLGIRNTTLDWFKSYLTDRSQRVEIDGLLSNVLNISCGVAVWFKANKMAVNVSKTNYIVFHTRGKQVNLNGRDIIFNSNEINVITPDPALTQKVERIHNKHNNSKMQSFKLLGVFLDEHLTLNKHTDYITAKLSRALYLINRVKHFVSCTSLRKLTFL